MAGIYTAKKASYGYIMGTDEKRTPVIDEEVAPIVVRIFEMYAMGISPVQIANTFNVEGVPSPNKYALEKYGHKGTAKNTDIKALRKICICGVPSVYGRSSII